MLLAIFACCGLLAIGCSDDTPAPAGGETDTGTTTDTGGNDMGTPDEGSEDNGMDGTVTPDTDTPDTDGPIDNGIVYAGCVIDPDLCTDTQICRGGICVDEITSADDYIGEAAARDSSYWWSLQFPSEFEDIDDSSCCFDYTNDGNPDNQLGFILSIIGPFLSEGGGDTSLQPMIDTAFEDGEIVILSDYIEFDGTDGETDFAVLVGDLEKDADGNPVESFATRAAGDGNYTVQDMSLDEYGPQVRFGLATIDDGLLTTELSVFNLTIAIEQLGDDPISLSLEAAKIEAEVALETNGVHTVDREQAGEVPFMGGGKLGGVVVLEEFLGIFENLAAECECLTEGEDLFVYAYDFSGGSLQLECNGNSGASSCSDAEPGVCGFLGTLCGITSIISGVPDVDLYACEEVVASGGTEQYRCGSDGGTFVDDPDVLNACECVYGADGIADSISIGMYFAMTGANITGFAE